ncbi:hypothetical protein [uncultured Nonlabens sp.]
MYKCISSSGRFKNDAALVSVMELDRSLMYSGKFTVEQMINFVY